MSTPTSPYRRPYLHNPMDPPSPIDAPGFNTPSPPPAIRELNVNDRLRSFMQIMENLGQVIGKGPRNRVLAQAKGRWDTYILLEKFEIIRGAKPYCQTSVFARKGWEIFRAKCRDHTLVPPLRFGRLRPFKNHPS